MKDIYFNKYIKYKLKYQRLQNKHQNGGFGFNLGDMKKAAEEKLAKAAKLAKCAIAKEKSLALCAVYGLISNMQSDESNKSQDSKVTKLTKELLNITDSDKWPKDFNNTVADKYLKNMQELMTKFLIANIQDTLTKAGTPDQISKIIATIILKQRPPTPEEDKIIKGVMASVIKEKIIEYIKSKLDDPKANEIIFTASVKTMILSSKGLLSLIKGIMLIPDTLLLIMPILQILKNKVFTPLDPIIRKTDEILIILGNDETTLLDKITKL